MEKCHNMESIKNIENVSIWRKKKKLEEEDDKTWNFIPLTELFYQQQESNKASI